jgi:E3 ubiquitin-protein ligase RAD18
MNEKALRKKLTELGIPTWGTKPLLQKRHQEWQLLWNSNCDASEEQRKSKPQLLRELDAWERLEGGHAKAVESKFMKKDFDGKDHANTHKSQFDELIANARKKRAVPKEEEKKEEISKDTEIHNDTPEKDIPRGESEASVPRTVNPAQPYEGNEAALTTIRQKVEETNRNGATIIPPLSREPSLISQPSAEAESAPKGDIGMQDPFTVPDRKLPMFAVPEDPVVDVDTSTAVQ